MKSSKYPEPTVGGGTTTENRTRGARAGKKGTTGAVCAVQAVR
jgi:hypothetical protein